MKKKFLLYGFNGGGCFATRSVVYALLFVLTCSLFVYSSALAATALPAAKQPASTNLAKTNAIAATNLPIVVEIPKSVFVWNPKDPGFGRDPFYPPKPRTTVAVTPTDQTVITSQQSQTQPTSPPKPKMEFVLSGIIGKMACIVNGKQIAVGNTEMVPCAERRVKVKCDKIENDTVFITVFSEDGSTETRELNLKTKR